MAAALLPNPDLLFLDEPFEGVDAVTSRVIRDLLAGFVARGSTVFLTSHVLEIVERLCTHVGIIVKGKLVEQASLDTIRQGGSLEDCFLQKAGAEHDGLAQAQLARGGGVVNWQHLQAFLWLRWRLLENQWRRAGAVNAVLMMIVSVGALLTAIPLFIGCFMLGLYADSQGHAGAAHVCVGRRDRRLSVLLGHWPDRRAAADGAAVALEVPALARVGQRGVSDQLC